MLVLPQDTGVVPRVLASYDPADVWADGVVKLNRLQPDLEREGYAVKKVVVMLP